MHIGIDATSIFGRSGIERYCRELIRALLSGNPDVRFSLFSTFKSAIRIKQLFDFPNAVIKNVLPHDLMLGPQLTWLTDIIKYLQWRRNSGAIDLFHQPQCRTVPPFNNFIITIFDLFPLCPEYGISKRIRRFNFKKFVDGAVNKARCIIVTSQYVASSFREYYPDSVLPRIAVIQLAAGDEFTVIEPDGALLQTYQLSAERPYFLFVGRIDKRKNIERTIRVFHALEGKRGNVLLILALSGFQEDIAFFQKQFAKELSTGAIRCLFSVPDEHLVHLYNAARAFVFPSLAEGFGLPVLEAMQCGCPVITSENSSLSEVAGNAALLINPVDEHALRDAMLAMIKGDENRNKYRTLGLNRARQFSWQRTAQETMEVYKSVLGH